MKQAIKPPALSLRPVTPDDEAFLMDLYASTRPDVEAWACGEEEKEAFFLAQHRVQDHFFNSRYPDAKYLVIQNDGQAIGRLYTSRTAQEIRILDITLLPECRDRGIGSAVIMEVLEEAKSRPLPVSLMVERFNQARTLYERLGFRTMEDSGTHFLMEWTP